MSKKPAPDWDPQLRQKVVLDGHLIWDSETARKVKANQFVQYSNEPFAYQDSPAVKYSDTSRAVKYADQTWSYDQQHNLSPTIVTRPPPPALAMSGNVTNAYVGSPPFTVPSYTDSSLANAGTSTFEYPGRHDIAANSDPAPQKGLVHTLAKYSGEVISKINSAYQAVALYTSLNPTVTAAVIGAAGLTALGYLGKKVYNHYAAKGTTAEGSKDNTDTWWSNTCDVYWMWQHTKLSDATANVAYHSFGTDENNKKAFYFKDLLCINARANLQERFTPCAETKEKLNELLDNNTKFAQYTYNWAQFHLNQSGLAKKFQITNLSMENDKDGTNPQIYIWLATDKLDAWDNMQVAKAVADAQTTANTSDVSDDKNKQAIVQAISKIFLSPHSAKFTGDINQPVTTWTGCYMLRKLAKMQISSKMHTISFSQTKTQHSQIPKTSVETVRMNYTDSSGDALHFIDVPAFTADALEYANFLLGFTNAVTATQATRNSEEGYNVTLTLNLNMSVDEEDQNRASFIMSFIHMEIIQSHLIALESMYKGTTEPAQHSATGAKAIATAMKPLLAAQTDLAATADVMRHDIANFQ